MTRFLLELASEEIPARMQAAAAEQLATRFTEGCKAAGLAHGKVTADATPRRLWLIADDVAAASEGSAEEVKGPRADAPPQAIEGFLKKTGLTREALEERDTGKGIVLFAMLRREGRAASAILADLIPQIVTGFQWPKSMRWGDASASTASPRWVRPLTGIVALLGDDVVECTAHGRTSGRITRGHRIHAPEPLSIGSADSYAAQLRDARVIASSTERRALIEAKAAAAAQAAGLTIIPDAGLVAENAGLTEWPVPLLGRFDPAFLTVPREVIQLTMRTNQKYFACADAAGNLAPAFVCVANLEARDGGTAIIGGNERVLSARLSDARFFWEQDVAAVKAGGLESFTPKLSTIVFHEKLGTVADKVERVAALAKWLAPMTGADPEQAERAARLAKADLVTATVGEFPEVQGLIGRYLALAAGEDAAVADAIRDHYKPAGQGDDVPTAPVSVAVALADKLDTIGGFFAVDERPTGSKDPFAIRRAALGVIQTITRSSFRVPLKAAVSEAFTGPFSFIVSSALEDAEAKLREGVSAVAPHSSGLADEVVDRDEFLNFAGHKAAQSFMHFEEDIVPFLIDRLKVQQREAGVRHDLIDAVFALGGEDDLVRLLARVCALQAFIATDDGANLLAGTKRAANILKIEDAKDGPHAAASLDSAGLAHPAEAALVRALDVALPAAATAVAHEDFTAAMTALASLRAPVDAFFADVMVNDPDAALRRNRLALLARFRDAVQTLADFGRIEG